MHMGTYLKPTLEYVCFDFYLLYRKIGDQALLCIVLFTVKLWAISINLDYQNGNKVKIVFHLS